LRKIQIELPLPPPKAAAELISLPGAAADPKRSLRSARGDTAKYAGTSDSLLEKIFPIE
jgi:hypothetical protein